MMGGRTILAVALGASALWLGGCNLGVGRTPPPPPAKFGEIESEERGEVVTVNDTMIDLRTGQAPAGSVRTPGIPIGPAAISLPVSIGGESRRDIPGEEITVRVAGNKLVVVVQPLSQPPYAPGERVLVQREKPNIITSESRMRVIRDDSESVIRPAR